MKRMKWLAALLIATSVLLVFVGPASAYMRKQTEVVENVFVPADVSCQVNEIFQDNEKTEITVTNTGDIEAYLRLRLVTYWVDDKGVIVFEASPAISFDYNDTDWLKSGDVYYYRKPVLPGDSTEDLFGIGGSIQLEDDTNGNCQVVEVFAEAIQSKPSEAVTSAWSVNLDSNGNITE